jgi:hypothetical protein
VSHSTSFSPVGLNYQRVVLHESRISRRVAGLLLRALFSPHTMFPLRHRSDGYAYDFAVNLPTPDCWGFLAMRLGWPRQIIS